MTDEPLMADVVEASLDVAFEYPLGGNVSAKPSVQRVNPISYSLMERRAMYFLTGEVKHKFAKKGLDVPENWKELYFYLTDKDLGIIGGSKNVPRTYETLTSLGQKFIPITYTTPEGKKLEGKVHWVDTFFYDKQTNRYIVRISPEIMPYLINLTNSFTSFDIGIAMMLRSKYSQKLYEICCKYGGDYRYSSSADKATGYSYKKRVVPIKLEKIRSMFNLDEQKDPRTGKAVHPGSFKSFKDIRVNILKVAQEELYWMYKNKASDVWFDFQPGPRTGKGGKVSSVILYIYTRKHPKIGPQRPWQKGDEHLDPYESPSTQQPSEKKTPSQRVHSNAWYDYEHQDRIVYTLLSRYLTKKEVSYYMRIIGDQAKRFRDSYIQVIQVIQEKETQSKFANGTRQYKRNNIMDYVLQVNLKDFGWSIKPPSTRKERKRNDDMFDG
jgi:plasmid replication initiation protein